MLMDRKRRSTIWTLRGWVISVLQEADAIHECEEHGWMQDRADPHARERAFVIARDVLNSIGDTCPDCPSDAK
jgi:hypothetical protein